MSEHTEYWRLPETWEEYARSLQLARREGFCRGARVALQHGLRPSEIGEESIRSYPITRKVPRSIVLESGAVARATAEGVEIDGVATRPTNSVLLRHGSVQALMELMKNPFDEVAE